MIGHSWHTRDLCSMSGNVGVRSCFKRCSESTSRCNVSGSILGEWFNRVRRNMRHLQRDLKRRTRMMVALQLPIRDSLETLESFSLFCCRERNFSFLLVLEDVLQNGTVFWFFSRQWEQCVGSKKLRCVSTRTILSCRSQSMLELVFKIFRRLMCRITVFESRSPKICTTEKMIFLEVLKTQKDDRFFRGIQIDLIILRTYTHVSIFDYFHLFGISLIIRWNWDFCQCIDTHGRYSGKLV